jgi:excinuclease ABC subunit C
MTTVDADAYDASFAAAPNLVVIDGGKGQLGAALAAMAEHDLPRVAVVSLAKREEEVFVPGRSDPIHLPRDSAGLQLLQRIRDEAHRFALGFHRQRRGKQQVDSIFNTLPGVGPARKRLLMQHFKTADALLAASRQELEAVPGLPPKVGRGIHDRLHKTG